jgi:hypothetical protein
VSSNKLDDGSLPFGQLELLETEQVETEQVETEQVETEQVETEQVETEQVETEQVETEPPVGERIPTSPEPITPELTDPIPLRTKNDNVYYMPVDNLRAQVYLAHGLIYPGIYDKAGLSADFDDSQRLSPAELTLFEDPQPLKKNQLLLKVLLQLDEVTDADHSGSMLRFPLPLPISRISGIEVPQEVGDLDRFVDGWVKPDVPVPRHLFSLTLVPPVENHKDQVLPCLKGKAESRDYGVLAQCRSLFL